MVIFTVNFFIIPFSVGSIQMLTDTQQRVYYYKMELMEHICYVTALS